MLRTQDKSTNKKNQENMPLPKATNLVLIDSKPSNASETQDKDLITTMNSFKAEQW